MKAIHNYAKISASNILLCSIRQRYKMKAIHNANTIAIGAYNTVFNTSKIQNESNSQPRR